VTRILRILSIYVAWQVTMSFLAFIGGISGLILLFDTIELLRRTAGNDAVTFGTVFGLALLKLPHTAQATLPFAVMLAMMYALFRLSRSHELLVMRAAGVSVWQFLAPPLVLTLALGFANLAVFDPFAANLYDSYQRLEDALIRRSTTSLNVGKGGLWLREAQGSAVTIVHADTMHSEGDVVTLNALSVFKMDGEKAESRFEAADGRLADGHLSMSAVWEIELGGGKAVSTYHDTYRLPTALTADKIQDSLAAPETMSFWDLPEFIRSSQAAGFSALPHRLYWQSLLASPFMLCAMVLVASAFYLTVSTRLQGWMLRGAAGIGTGFVVYFLNHFTYALGLSATLPLVLAAWAPTVATTMFGVAYLFHREDG
jgi:lipopolysaccharide export system permease protein